MEALWALPYWAKTTVYAGGVVALSFVDGRLDRTLKARNVPLAVRLVPRIAILVTFAATIVELFDGG